MELTDKNSIMASMASNLEAVDKYVEMLKGKTPIVKAEKSGRILARIGVEGERIDTYVSNGTLETTRTVSKDENGNLDIVVTMANENGEPVIDANEHTNTYIMGRKTFEKKYQNAENIGINEKLFKPTGGVQDFIRINEDIDIITTWGEVQHLKAGSMLNITREGHIYGIAFEEFVKTYSFVDEKTIDKDNKSQNIETIDDNTEH